MSFRSEKAEEAMSQGLPGDHRWRLAPPKLLRVDMRQVWLFGELARLPGVECRVYCDQTPLKLSCCVAIMAYWLKPPSIPEMKIVWAQCDMSYSGEVQTRKHEVDAVCGRLDVLRWHWLGGSQPHGGSVVLDWGVWACSSSGVALLR